MGVWENKLAGYGQMGSGFGNVLTALAQLAKKQSDEQK